MPPHHLSSTWHALTNRELPHVLASLVHVNTSSSCMDATCHPASGATWHPHFPCFINTTKRDNFLIRSPFEVKRTPLESSRRALRSGAGFAEIGGLQKFCLLGSSWITISLSTPLHLLRGFQNLLVAYFLQVFTFLALNFPLNSHRMLVLNFTQFILSQIQEMLCAKFE